MPTEHQVEPREKIHLELIGMGFNDPVEREDLVNQIERTGQAFTVRGQRIGAPIGIHVARFACPTCGAKMDNIPQLFPRVTEGQSRRTPGATCTACGWRGDFGEALDAGKRFPA